MQLPLVHNDADGHSRIDLFSEAALWRAKRNTIRKYFERGAEVEPGLRRIKMRTALVLE